MPSSLQTCDSLQIKPAAANHNIKAEPDEQALQKHLLDKNNLVDSLMCEIKELGQKSVDDGNIIKDQKVDIRYLEKI